MISRAICDNLYLCAEMKKRMSDKEIKKFNALAADWWQPTGSMEPLHRINPLRCLFLDTYVSVAGKRVLDIGCGGGLFAESMAERGARVTAIDPAPDLIEAARRHSTQSVPSANISYRVAEVQDLIAEGDGPYDMVSCLEVLEHTEEPEELMKRSVQLIKPGGWGYFSTINRTPLAFAKMIVAAEYALGWLPRGTHSYRQFIRPSEMASCLLSHKMELIDMKGITYDVLRRKFVLSSKTDTNYLLLTRKSAS